MAKDATGKEQTVVATFEVTTPEGITKIKGHDKAWRATRQGPHPAHGKFIGWERV